jgi:hypothetical protein
MNRLLAFLGFWLLLLPGVALGQPKLMLDDELDKVTASGGLVSFSLNENNEVSFELDLGTTFGNGSVALSPTPGGGLPPNFSLDNLLNATFQVQSLIINLNLCVQCQATNINQIGLGLGITNTPFTP